MKNLQVAILGMGYIGAVHLKNLSTLPNVSIVALCDTNKEKIEKYRSEDKNILIFDNFDQMLATCTIDILFICLPPFAHKGEFIKAASKGIHIFIEKPIALSINEGAELVASAKKNGIKTHVGYMQRFGSAITKLREIVDTGKAGRPILFDGRYDCNSLHAPWWRDKEKSNSQVFEQVIHTFDMALYFFGSPQLITGYMANLCHQKIENYTIEDVSASCTKFENGALATICATNCATPCEWNNPYTLVFENLTVHIFNPNHGEFIFTKENPVRKEIHHTETNMYLQEIIYFIDTIQNNKISHCGIEAGLASLNYVDAVVNSANRGGDKVIFNRSN